MAETDLLELFEKASKAARKACNREDDGERTAVVDASEETRCTDALKAMGAVEISTSLLLSTRVGKRLRKLTKHSSLKISKSAQDLLQVWRKVVSMEANSTSNKKLAPKRSRPSSACADVSLAKVSPIQSAKVPQIQSMEVKGTKPAANLVCSSSSSGQEVRSLGPIPKAPGDGSRDRIRELLVEALAKVGKEAAGDELQEAQQRNVVEVAVALENAMFAKLGLATGKEKAKYRLGGLGSHASLQGKGGAFSLGEACLLISGLWT